MKKILIVGGSGFVGTNLIKILAKKKNILFFQPVLKKRFLKNLKELNIHKEI